MRNVYKCIIRPHLENCAQLWSPPATHGNWSVIIELESVQRRFTRLIDGIGTAPYSGRLEALQLTTLAERRIRGDLIEVFKIVNGLVEYGNDLFCVSRSGDKLISMPSVCLIKWYGKYPAVLYLSVLFLTGIKYQDMPNVQSL